jgi:hypothetical protein
VISDPPFSTRLRALLQHAPSFVGVIGFDDGAAPFTPFTPDATVVRALSSLPGSPLGDEATARPLPGPAVLIARTLTDLVRARHYAEHLPSARHLYIEVTEMAETSRPTSIALPPTRPWQTMTEQRIRRDRSGRWSIETILDQPADLASLVRACGGHRTPRARPQAPRIGLVGDAAVRWGAGTWGRALAPLREGVELNAYPSADVVLHSVPAAAVPDWDGHTRLVEVPAPHSRPGAVFPDPGEPVHEDPDPRHLPPVDESTVNPIGFRWDTAADDATLAYDGRGWRVHSTTAGAFSLPSSGAVTDTDVERCRGLRSIALDWNSHPGTVAGAATVAGLAAAGVPLISNGRTPEWAEAVGNDLLDRIDRYDAADLKDPLLRELHSVRLRRAALAEHGASYRRTPGLPAAPTGPETVSVILCTRRQTFLKAAFAQINAQCHDHVELVLVLHGIAANDPEVHSATAELKVPLTIVEVASTAPFGTALNAGLAAATGKYVTKFDDDDWYGPHHVPDLLLAARYSGADLIGTQPEFVHLEALDLTIHKRPGRSERFAVHVSGATMLLRRDDLVELGGYRPLRTSEDRGLLQDVQHRGGSVYCTHGFNFLVSRRTQGHTWIAPPASFLRNNDRQWHGIDLGPAIAADTLEEHLYAQKGTVAPR